MSVNKELRFELWFYSYAPFEDTTKCLIIILITAIYAAINIFIRIFFFIDIGYKKECASIF